MQLIQLQSSDGEIFETDVKAAQCSFAVKSMLESCREDDDEDALVPLLNVDSRTLVKVLEWASYHKNDFDNEEFAYLACDWDTKFLNEMNQTMLFDVMLAANYLDIKGLLDLTCKAVAGMITDKTPEEIQDFFNISEDGADFNDESDDESDDESEPIKENVKKVKIDDKKEAEKVDQNKAKSEGKNKYPNLYSFDLDGYGNEDMDEDNYNMDLNSDIDIEFEYSSEEVVDSDDIDEYENDNEDAVPDGAEYGGAYFDEHFNSGAEEEAND